MLVLRPSRYLARIMRIDPVQRQSVISLTSTIGLTAVGFLSTMYFAHTVGLSILGAYYLLLPTSAYSTCSEMAVATKRSRERIRAHT